MISVSELIDQTRNLICRGGHFFVILFSFALTKLNAGNDESFYLVIPASFHLYMN